MNSIVEMSLCERDERRAKVGEVFCIIEVTSDLVSKKPAILHMCGHR